MSLLPADANLVLVGFMGVGKTAVGRALARRLGRPFVDTDQEVERRTGRGVPAIFATDGEPAFRALEREAVAEAAAGRGLVVATGGGAPVDPVNLAALQGSGLVVYLAARPETLLSRVGRGEGRPVLAGGDQMVRIRELLERREPAYRRADLVIETDRRSVASVASLVLKAARARGIR